MSRIKKHGAFLQYLVRAKPKERKQLIKNASKVELNSVCEVCKNILAGRIPLRGQQQHRRLCRYKNILRKLANRGVRLETKRRLLQQQSGGALLPLLAPLVIPLISSLVSSIAGRSSNSN